MAAELPKPGTAAPKSGVVVPNAPVWYQRLGARVIWLLIRVVTATLRFRWENRSGHTIEAPGGPLIYCVWHNRLALSMDAYYREAAPRSRGCGLAAMVSASKDGALLAAVLAAFRVQPVRGSSSRRGRQALLELTSWAQRGYDLAITPDGPRGPCYVVQSGVISLAQLTGRPIVPVSYYAQWKLQMKTWDRFQIPLPFSRCDMVFGEPIQVPRDADETRREEIRRRLEQTLKAMSKD